MPEDSWYVEIGRQIRLFRQAKDWTQADLARHYHGVTHAAISDIERGRSKPNVDELMMLARVLGVPVAWLLAPVLNASPMR